MLGDCTEGPAARRAHARFGALTYCSELEADGLRHTRSQDKAFNFRRHALFPHVEVLPIPGLRPGSVSYLVPAGSRRVLLAINNLGFDGKRWAAFLCLEP